jgi:hypothetical protein
VGHSAYVSRGPERFSGRAGSETDRVAQLAVTYGLACHRCATAKLAAQLAHNALLSLIDMYALADEGGACAVFAAMAISRKRADTAPQ